MRRTLPVRVLLVMVLAAVLAACGGDGSSDEATPVPRMDESLDVRMGRFDQTLREEANWLWENMNLARANPRPEAERCTAPRDWDHRPVVMDAEARRLDPTAARLVDYLDYAAALIAQARDEWARHCQNELSAMNAVVFLESRLTPAYQSLNLVRDVLDQRAASR